MPIGSAKADISAPCLGLQVQRTFQIVGVGSLGLSFGGLQAQSFTLVPDPVIGQCWKRFSDAFGSKHEESQLHVLLLLLVVELNVYPPILQYVLRGSFGHWECLGLGCRMLRLPGFPTPLEATRAWAGEIRARSENRQSFSPLPME